MLPTISPPTDNMYKFMSISGLDILVLRMINMIAQQQELFTNKVEIENIQQEQLSLIKFYYEH